MAYAVSVTIGMMILAQLIEVSWKEAFFAYGPLGIVCAWLMFRTEKKLESLGENIVTELRVLGHRINGMSRAMLADVASRESTGQALRVLANRELEKLETEPEVAGMRAKSKFRQDSE